MLRSTRRPSASLVLVAQEIEEEARHDKSAPPGETIRIDRNLLTDLGVEPHSDEEARRQLAWFGRTLEERVGMRLAHLMLTEQVEEFEALIDNEDETAALDFLETEFPEYVGIVRETLSELKDQIRDGTVQVPRIDPEEFERSQSPLRHVANAASVLSEWLGYADRRQWNTWYAFSLTNRDVICSSLAMTLLDLSIRRDPNWGRHEAAAFCVSRMADNGFHATIFVDFQALADLLKGALDAEDYETLYLGGAYISLRFPEQEMGWFYGAIGASRIANIDLVQMLLREAGDRKPPSERHEGAARLLQLQTSAGWDDATLALMIEAYTNGKQSRPIKDLEAEVERHPGDAQRHYDLGIALQKADRFDEAAEAYQRAATLDPANVSRQRAFAGALHAAGHFEVALEAIDIALDVNPMDPISHAVRGMILGELGRHEEAVTAVSIAVRLAPSVPEYSHNLGVELQRLGRHDEAIEAFRQALRLQPNAARYRALAASLGTGNRPEEAIKSIRAGLALDPADPVAYQILSAVQQRVKDYEGAIGPCARRLNSHLIT